MFTKAPFADTAGSLDGWVPPVDVGTVIFGLATNQRFMLADYQRYLSPLEPGRSEDTTPQHSVLDQLVAPPYFLPSGSR